MTLAERVDLPELLDEPVRPGGECEVNVHLKVGFPVGGMAAGADSIDDMGLLRHWAMAVLFDGVRGVVPPGVRGRSAPAIPRRAARLPGFSLPQWPVAAKRGTATTVGSHAGHALF
jgi:hypothetical protein